MRFVSPVLHMIYEVLHGLRLEASHVVYFIAIERGLHHLAALDWSNLVDLARLKATILEVLLLTLTTTNGGY